MAADHFHDFRLKVARSGREPGGAVAVGVASAGQEEFITMHHCIQGWSGIAQWSGVPMKKLIDLVKPKPSAKDSRLLLLWRRHCTAARYYDTQSLDNVLKPECLLALRDERSSRLPDVYGAPLRLRVENQLGYKMVKWIERIEFIESEKQVGEGEGGKNEDDEYFDLLPNI